MGADANSPGPCGLYDLAVEGVGPEARPFEAGSRCPICSASEVRPVFRVAGWAAPVVACTSCGLARFEPMPTDAEIRAFYPDSYYGDPGRKFWAVVEGLVRFVGARHVRFLTRRLPRGSRVLDVGCGRGVLLSELAERGFEPHGVELSEAAARGADPRAQIRIVPNLKEAGYPEAFFDEVIIWHVLEHLRDPRGTLEEVHRILRPGGRLIVAVPNFASLQARWSGAAWFHLDLPRHLYHFPVAALRTLLERVGFACRSEHHFSLRQNPFGWLQSALNRCTRLPRNGLYTLLHRRIPGMPPPFDPPTRRRLRAWWIVGAPFALALGVLETAFRTGGTVHVVAERVARAQEPPP